METYTPETQAAEKPLGTGAFFGLAFVLALPVIGLIVSLILSLACRHQTIKTYARAMLIWSVIGHLILVILIVGALRLWQALP